MHHIQSIIDHCRITGENRKNVRTNISSRAEMQTIVMTLCENADAAPLLYAVIFLAPIFCPLNVVSAME